MFSLNIINFSYIDNNIVLRMLIMSTFKLNNFIKISSIFIILLLLSTPIYSVDESEDSHAYAVPVVVNFVNITDNGESFHSDEVTYTLDGSENVVYYRLAKKDGQKIDNISIESDGYYYDYEVNDTNDHTDIRVVLYADDSKKNKLRNGSLKVIYHYRSINTVDVYDDVALFNYTPWADSQTPVSKLETYITYPAEREDIQIYDNPPHILSSHSWVNRHRYETRYKELTPSNNYRQVALMPTTAFKSNDYTNNIKQSKKESIIKYQDDYAKNVAFNNNLGYLLIAISVLLIVTPLVISFNYFKNSDIKDMNNRSIDELDDDYIKVNMILNTKCGNVNKDALYATILNLINKKHIRTKFIGDNLSLKIISHEDKILEEHESFVLDYLSESIDEYKSINEFKNMIKHNQLTNLYDNFKDICNRNYSIDEYFTDKTSRYLKYYSIIALIYLSVILIILNTLTPKVPIFTWTFRAAVVLVPMIILAYMLSVKIKNNWNKEGKLHHDRWKQFESYLNDYSQIINNPPQSPSKWADYIVYSAAMGVDLSFRQNMVRYLDEHDMKEPLDDDLIRLFYYDDKRSLFLD